MLNNSKETHKYAEKTEELVKKAKSFFIDKHLKLSVVSVCLVLTIGFSVSSAVPQINELNMPSRPGISSQNPFSGLKLTSLAKQMVVKATKAESLKLDKSTADIYGMDSSVSLKATISPNDTTNKSVTYESSDEEVALVSKNGTVTPVADGTVDIICKTADGSGLSAKCTVNVSTEPLKQSIELSDTELSFDNFTDTAKLKPEFTPGGVDTSVSFESTDSSVAEVSNDGTVTPVSNGTAEIICTSDADETVTASCDVTVDVMVKAEKMYLNYATIDYVGLGCMEQLEPTFEPADVTEKTPEYVSDNPEVARVDEKGIVYPVGNGTCKITATTKDGSDLTETCDVTVSGVVDYVQVTSQNVVIPQNLDITTTAGSVIEEAQKYVGWLPYVWGGTSLTSGVDCSGFICAVYEKFGYNLWGLRTDLYLAGTEVPSLAEAKAGDILVYSGHVAIYDGNGGKIHAPDVGYMVSHDHSVGNYKSIRRIIN